MILPIYSDSRPIEKIINPEKNVIIKTKVVYPSIFIAPEYHFKKVANPKEKENAEKNKPMKLKNLKGNNEELIRIWYVSLINLYIE